jgi:hypothetical protein
MSELAPDIAAALSSALQAIADERETHAHALDNLARVTRESAEQHHAGNLAASHASIARALDLAFELLGECDAIEPLAAMLGYSDPEPSEVLS